MSNANCPCCDIPWDWIPPFLPRPVVPCCENSLPRRLFVTVESPESADVTVPIDWDDANERWQTDGVVSVSFDCGQSGFFARLECVGTGESSVFVFSKAHGDSGLSTSNGRTAASCDPFLISFPATVGSGGPLTGVCTQDDVYVITE